MIHPRLYHLSRQFHAGGALATDFTLVSLFVLGKETNLLVRIHGRKATSTRLAAFRCDFLDLLFRPVGEVSWVRVVCRCHDAGSFGLRKLKSLEVFRYLEKILCVPVVDGCIGNGRVSPTFIFGLLGG
jgi:hypothetical protein